MDCKETLQAVQKFPYSTLYFKGVFRQQIEHYKQYRNMLKTSSRASSYFHGNFLPFMKGNIYFLFPVIYYKNPLSLLYSLGFLCVTLSLNLRKSTFSPKINLCFAFFSKKQQLCPYTAVWLMVYTVEKESVSCELRNDYLKKINLILSLEG